MTLTRTAREVLPLTNELAYLNTASMGPVTTIYADALREATACDVRSGRAVASRYRSIDRARTRIRAEVAQLLGCEPATVRLTQSTSAGLEAAIDAFDWRPGDEVLTTDAEHEACAAPLRRLAARRDVVVRTAGFPADAGDDTEWLHAALTPRTRLIAMSAVTYEAGARLPVRAIAEIARAREIATLVDGAQCAGAAALLPADWGVDFCAIPLQKWLCGPEGLGALYVRAESEPRLAEPPADRVVQGHAVLEAAATHLEWLRRRIGWRAVFERTGKLAAYAREALSRIDEARILTPTAHAGIVTVRCPAARGDGADRKLAGRGILVRHLPQLGAFRVSTAFFNDEQEIDRLVSAIRTLR